MAYIENIHESTEQLTVKEKPSDVELILSCMTCLQEEC